MLILFKFIAIVSVFCIGYVSCYFTLPGKCPENVQLQGEFRLADFYGRWHQTHHYSSDGQVRSNCTKIELITRPTGIYLNQSRVDRGLFHRYSIARLDIPPKIEDAADLNVNFVFENAPRRLMTRRYPFRVLATNYNYYATVYTCSYSPLIDKHYIYIWILSRNEVLNDVSRELALKPLQKLGVDTSKIVKDDLSKCRPKYYEDIQTEPLTFNQAVPIV